jgi:hypothetical protein
LAPPVVGGPSGSAGQNATGSAVRARVHGRGGLVAVQSYLGEDRLLEHVDDLRIERVQVLAKWIGGGSRRIVGGIVRAAETGGQGGEGLRPRNMGEVLARDVDDVDRGKGVFEDQRDHWPADGQGVPDLPPDERVVPPRVRRDAADDAGTLFDALLELCREVLIRIQVTTVPPGAQTGGPHVAVEAFRALTAVLAGVGDEHVVSHRSREHDSTPAVVGAGRRRAYRPATRCGRRRARRAPGGRERTLPRRSRWPGGAGRSRHSKCPGRPGASFSGRRRPPSNGCTPLRRPGGTTRRSRPPGRSSVGEFRRAPPSPAVTRRRRRR